MLHIKPYLKICCSVLLMAIWFISCEKEYSCEGACNVAVPPVDTSIINLPDTTSPQPADTSNNSPLSYPTCNICGSNPPQDGNPWSFRIGNSYLCGSSDTAIVTLERDAFTFFGPSACSIDEGLIFTVYLSPLSLTSTQTNMVAPFASFIYYNSNSANYLSSRTAQPFRFVLLSYDHSTKQAAGTFEGVAYRLNGTSVNVTSGLFKIKLI